MPHSGQRCLPARTGGRGASPGLRVPMDIHSAYGHSLIHSMDFHPLCSSVMTDHPAQEPVVCVQVEDVLAQSRRGHHCKLHQVCLAPHSTQQQGHLGCSASMAWRVCRPSARSSEPHHRSCLLKWTLASNSVPTLLPSLSFVLLPRPILSRVPHCLCSRRGQSRGWTAT